METRDVSNAAVTRRRTAFGVLGGLVGFLVASVLAAVLVVAAMVPVVAVSAIATTNTINVFENLPDYLSIEPLSEKSNIYATGSDGAPRLLASFYDQNRVEVGWEQISQYVKDAAVASEDPRFYEHGGVDLQGTLRAAVTTVVGGDIQGGSSITQQYVKNVLVQRCETESDKVAQQRCYDAATETTADRKLKEMRLAVGLEGKYTKDEILRQYLNITGFGGTVYGIEAAAEYYFGVSAAALTLPQAASLVAIVNNPFKFQLDRPESQANGAANGYAANKQRRDYVLGQMLRYRKILPEEYRAAVAVPVEPSIHEPSTGCQTAGGSAFFCDYVLHILQNDPAFGDNADTRMLKFRRGGYNVYTTLDLDLQNAAEAAIAANIPTVYGGGDLGAVVSSVQVGSGRVLAMAENKDYSQDPAVQATGANFTGINYNTDYDYGGSSGFQPGSTYKIFTLAEWLKEGHSLNERVDSRRKANWGTFQDSCLGPQNYDKEGFNPLNDEVGENAPNYTALESTIRSINTGFIGMAKRLDLCGIRKTAEAFDMHRADGDPLGQSAASVIGTNEVAPLSVAVAFAGIANQGVTCTPIAIDRIVGRDGAEIPPPTSTCAPSVDPSVAAGMAFALHQVMTRGTAAPSNARTLPNLPMIAKTGTTDGAKDTWMSGASTKVATTVAVVAVTGSLDQRHQRVASGLISDARHRIWPAVMSVANAKYGGDAFVESATNPAGRVTQPAAGG
ncbi:transglycosylase domain-containing protein [Glaciibacter sp. 2TAF33]|uniref:transglycosylase domain-containing protein n=1 Tax=Glaciibacter sp. 2TAF33 TaxID=3233015 RepID=UPI003F937D76